MKRLVLLTSILLSGTALGYDHAHWSGSRGSYYRNSYQFTTQTEMLHSRVELEEDGVRESLGTFKGPGIKASLGVELVRFVRFSAYHLYRDQSNNPSNSLRGSEVGGVIKVSFYGPVINLNLGIGASATRTVQQNLDGATVYFGQGMTSLFEFERFLAEKLSFTFGFKGQQERLSPEDTSLKHALKASTVGINLGLTLWLE